MNQAWYQVASMGFGYLSAAIIALIVLCWPFGNIRKTARSGGGSKEPAADGRGGPLYCAFRREPSASGRNRAARAV